MPNPKRRSPESAPHRFEATNQKQRNKSTSLASEILGMAIAAAIFSATVWQSVFGMADMDQPEAITVMAEVKHGR